MKKTCRSPELVHLEWVSVLAEWAIRTQSGRWGGGEGVGFYRHITCFLGEEKLLLFLLLKFCFLFTLNFFGGPFKIPYSV